MFLIFRFAILLFRVFNREIIADSEIGESGLFKAVSSLVGGPRPPVAGVFEVMFQVLFRKEWTQFNGELSKDFDIDGEQIYYINA